MGSTGLALQGVTIEPKDIDITISRENVERVQELLRDFCLQPIQYSSNGQFRSFFGKFDILGIKVEIMADLEILVGGNWIKSVAIDQPDTIVVLDGCNFPCVSLLVEYNSYVIMGRSDTANRIMAALNNH